MQGITSLHFQLFTIVEYAQWVSTSTPNPKLPGSNTTDVQSWTFGTNLVSSLSRLLLINIK